MTKTIENKYENKVYFESHNEDIVYICIFKKNEKKLKKKQKKNSWYMWPKAIL